jgi:predicted ATPase/DNA-binding CsgD family transcriptional regulator
VARYCSNACRQRAYRNRMKTTGLGGSVSISLQTQLNSFVGRGEELVEVTRLVRAARLVTLTGPPGAGKTRLAGELATQEQRAGRCDVVPVELASITNGDLVQRRIMTALRETDGRDAASHQNAAGRTRLLLLDNCEHLLDDCGAALAEVLAGRPQVRVLATSREPLRLPGEVVFPLRGLIPLRLEEGASATDLGRLPAVRLFVDRARALLPEFQLTEENSTQVSTVCARLDGLPLAIELAAGLVRAFPVADIERRMDDRLDLLAGGWRTSEPRHHSLRAALDWSHNLLTAQEQTLFRALSVLPGGFGADIAAAVAEGQGIPVGHVPHLLVRLEATSLITTAPGNSTKARFRMLESIRCYGQEQLLTSGEEERAHERLLHWLIGATEGFPETGILTSPAMLRLAVEAENLEFGLKRLRDGDDERQLPLAATSDVLAMLDDHPGQNSGQLSRALGIVSADSEYRPVGLATEAALAAWRGQHHEAEYLARTTVTGNGGAQQGRMEILLTLIGLVRGGRPALSELRACVRAGQDADDTVLTALCLYTLATQSVLCADPQKGITVLRDSLGVPSIRKLFGPFRALLHAAGTLALEIGDGCQASEYFRLLARESEHPHHRALALEGLAVVAVNARRYEQGVRLLAAAGSVGGADRRPAGRWWRKRVEIAGARAHEALSPARSDAALSFGRALTPQQAVHYALNTQPAAPAEELPAETLSERERKVALLVSQGLTNRQIAARLYVSVRTVETHVRNIRMALGLNTRAHLAAWTAERRKPNPQADSAPAARSGATSMAV